MRSPWIDPWNPQMDQQANNDWEWQERAQVWTCKTHGYVCAKCKDRPTGPPTPTSTVAPSTPKAVPTANAYRAPTRAQAKTQAQIHKWAIVTVVALIVVGIAVAAGLKKDPSTSGQDSGLACNDLRSAANDIGAGILTDSEMRGRFQTIYEDSSIANSEIHAAARSLLAADTSGSLDGIATAMHDMALACKAAGS